MAGPAQKVLTVSELTRRIKLALEDAIGDVWVEGELSNVRRPSSGHCYFTLKDAGSQLTGVLFRGDQRGLRFEIKDGLKVKCLGAITVYEPYGNYQIIVRKMEEAGKGSLQAQFEALKEKLQKEGLFDAARKRRLPALPRHVGIVTSRTGAAIQDILNVLTRRYPNLHIVLAPVKVQGDGAAAEIAAAIDLLNRRDGMDVLIVGRGGGSIEDLWAFNEEIVARAIARSAVPVISAVGHEIDFTISDFVADLRAPTPSAAAELLVGRKEDFERLLADMGRRIGRACRELARTARGRLQAAAGSYVFHEPANLVRQHLQRLDGFELRMVHALKGRAEAAGRRVEESALKCRHHIGLRQQAAGQEVRRLEMQLRTLNPLAVLDRGYSITRDGDGRILRSAAGLRAGQRIVTRLGEGGLESTVDAVCGSGISNGVRPVGGLDETKENNKG